MNLRTTPGAELASPATYSADSVNPGGHRRRQQAEQHTSFLSFLDNRSIPSQSPTPLLQAPADDDSSPAVASSETESSRRRKRTDNDGECQPNATEVPIPWPLSPSPAGCPGNKPTELPTNPADAAGQNLPTPPSSSPGVAAFTPVTQAYTESGAGKQSAESLAECLGERFQPKIAFEMDSVKAKELTHIRISPDPLPSGSPTESPLHARHNPDLPEAQAVLEDGMTVAKPVETMNSPVNQSSATQQETQVGVLPAQARLGGQGATTERIDTAVIHTLNFNSPVPASFNEVIRPEAPAENAERSSLVEGLRQEFRHQISFFKHTSAESIAVVLKPDPSTELLLHLKRADGKIEAVARCERGDFQLLSSHWSELRAQLQQQGVELQDLKARLPGSEFAPGTGFDRQGRQGNFHNQSEAGGSSTAHEAPTKPKRVLHNLRPNPRLLESWA